ncbi:MAG: tRNA-intron lyase [Euryarchaeota archaeon]|nr:tRNA-intron lyase [Euryarchaeota archaeon]
MVQISLVNSKVVISGKRYKKIWSTTGLGRIEKDKLVVSPEEAIALHLMGRIKLSDHVLDSIWEQTSRNPGTFKKVLALMDLIGRRSYKGHIGPDPYDISLWKKPEKPENSIPKIRVKLYYDYEEISVNDLLRILEGALYSKKRLMIGIVDEEGDILYYDVKKVDPIGGLSKVPEEKASGVFIGDRAIADSSSEKLNETFFGKKLFGMLMLSPLETEFLREKGYLVLKRLKHEEDLIEKLYKYDKSVKAKYIVYKDLRSRGHVVKSGFKYGAHFRVYKDNPNEAHSNYLVTVTTPEDKLRPHIVSSMVRLSQSVNKKFLLAVVLEDLTVQYIALEYIKP